MPENKTFKYIKVEPTSRRQEDVAYVPLATCDIGHLHLLDWLVDGEPFNMEDVENQRRAEAKVEDYGKTIEEADNALHSEVAEEFVELLNVLVHAPGGGEFSAESTFQLVEDKDKWDDEEEEEEEEEDD